ncbi:MAG TPA: putative sugar nucleotidyl transferase [Longimicrobiales bacterium]|nr:putative sugar nucleotidyl transferase [Longimicrobiales bacterium]
MIDFDLVLFDDAVARDWQPLTLTRPAGELLFGALRARERAETIVDAACIGHVTHADLIGFDEPGAPPVINLATLPTTRARLLLSSRAILDWETDLDFEQETTLYIGDEVIGWLVPEGNPAPSAEMLLEPAPNGGEKLSVTGRMLDHPWDLIEYNGEQILDDVAFMIDDVYTFDVSDDGIWVIGDHPVVRKNDVIIEPGVVFDVTEGPIWLDEGVTIRAFSRVAGPMYVGRGTTLLGGPYTACSIGPHCKVHGELEESIILGYSNKAHDGFLGHAYLGMWVNLGAMTTNSDLKNNYSPIRIWTPQGDVDTGQMKLGSLIGDHVKTAIGTLLNTGTVVGAGSNVFGGMPPKYLPPFSWGADGEYAFDKFIATAAVAMQRRGVPLNASQKDMLQRAWKRGRQDVKS